MRYIYVDNYRGIRDSLIPLSEVNFLVGENSTGKTSLLNAISLICNPVFWMDPVHALSSIAGHSFFDTISDKKNFSIGHVLFGKNKLGGWRCDFMLNEFRSVAGRIAFSRHRRFFSEDGDKGAYTEIKFASRTASFTYVPVERKLSSEEDAKTFFHDCLGGKLVNSPLTSFPKGLAADTPLPILASLAKGSSGPKENKMHELHFEIIQPEHVRSIAPIRSRPFKIYDGAPIGHSPSGEHIPNKLRDEHEKRSEFSEELKKFGQNSGLFDQLKVHSYENSARAPFELLVKVNNSYRNICDVGYGVSQSLPVAVELLMDRQGGAFLMQQPEVHLHPRAQAALGDLVFSVATQKKSSFFIETHSDYLIDRFRVALKKTSAPKNKRPKAQVLFFEHEDESNKVHSLEISFDGRYPESQPDSFRKFFINESFSLLEI